MITIKRSLKAILGGAQSPSDLAQGCEITRMKEVKTSVARKPYCGRVSHSKRRFCAAVAAQNEFIILMAASAAIRIQMFVAGSCYKHWENQDIELSWKMKSRERRLDFIISII